MAPVQDFVSQSVWVVTGGFGVAGGAIARAAKVSGAKVAVIGHGMPPPGLNFDHVQAGIDLADSAAAKRAMDAIADHLGSFDSLVNVAGGFDMQHLEEGVEVWEAMFRKNLLTTVHATRAALPHLSSPGGAIVNIASAAAGRAGAGMAPYSASKAAVLRLTESLAEELKPKGIRANAVSPTTIDTPDNRRAMPKADPAKWLAPEELAEIVLFLGSPAAAGVTGADIRAAGRT